MYKSVALNQRVALVGASSKYCENNVTLPRFPLGGLLAGDRWYLRSSAWLTFDFAPDDVMLWGVVLVTAASSPTHTLTFDMFVYNERDYSLYNLGYSPWTYAGATGLIDRVYSVSIDPSTLDDSGTHYFQPLVFASRVTVKCVELQCPGAVFDWVGTTINYDKTAAGVNYNAASWITRPGPVYIGDMLYSGADTADIAWDYSGTRDQLVELCREQCDQQG